MPQSARLPGPPIPDRLLTACCCSSTSRVVIGPTRLEPFVMRPPEGIAPAEFDASTIPVWPCSNACKPSNVELYVLNSLYRGEMITPPPLFPLCCDPLLFMLIGSDAVPVGVVAGLICCCCCGLLPIRCETVTCAGCSTAAVAVVLVVVGEFKSSDSRDLENGYEFMYATLTSIKVLCGFHFNC